MNQQERKEYNKEYYAKNKTKIIELISKKEPCKLCGKVITHQKMKKHQRSAYCMDKQDDLVEMKKQIEQLTEKMKSLEIKTPTA